MPLEETDRIDISTTTEDGKVQLVITDAGITTDPVKRLNLLIEKLKTYVSYVISEEFKIDHPGRIVKDVTILVMCRIPPTEQMEKITQVQPSGKPENAIPIVFQIFKGASV